MLIFPAIDLYDGKAVRLYKGDYDQMTVYSDDPVSVARDFVSKGAKYAHLVDLEGARDGGTPNCDTVLAIKKATGLFCEIGGGIRSPETVEKYLSSGVDRVILGTAALTDEKFLAVALKEYKEKISVGVDIRDGYVAVRGWKEKSRAGYGDFISSLIKRGVKHIIVTDISRDGAMKGTNRALYRELTEKYDIDVTASGGVSTLSDVRALKDTGVYGAIIGKAYYTGDIDLNEAVKTAEC